MKTTALADLKKITRFQQLRFRCKTRNHGDRLIHIKTVLNSTGAAVVDSFCRVTDERPASCGSYQAYGDDTSILSADCSKWKDGKWFQLDKNEKLFSHPIWTQGGGHWNLLTDDGRFECDDQIQAAVIRNGDIWEVFAR